MRRIEGARNNPMPFMSSTCAAAAMPWACVAGWTGSRPWRLPVIWDSVDFISFLFEQAVQSSRSLKGRLMTQLEPDVRAATKPWLVAVRGGRW